MISAVNQRPSFGTGFIYRSKAGVETARETLMNFAKENNLNVNPKAIVKTDYASGEYNHYLVDIKNNVDEFWNKFKKTFNNNAFRC